MEVGKPVDKEPSPTTTSPENPSTSENEPREASTSSTLSKTNQCLDCLKKNCLTLFILGAVLVGIALGTGLRVARKWTEREVMYVTFPGEIFLRTLQVIILPLIVSSLVSALGNLDAKLSRKIGLRALTYYVLTTLMAIVIGVILVVTIRPGYRNSSQIKHRENITFTTSLTEDTFLDLIRNMIPPNIIEACFRQDRTVLVKPSEETLTDMFQWDFKLTKTGGTNYLGLVVLSIVFGVTIGRMKEEAEILLWLFTCTADTMMVITSGVIWFSPIGIMFLVIGKILEMEDLTLVASQIGMYTATVLIGLAIHAIVVLPLVYALFLRRQPFSYIGNMMQAIVTAFATSSSSAALPVTIRCLEEKNGIDHRISRFVLPIGATINMDGTALYEAVAAIFIAQTQGFTLTAGNVVGISITATAASIGAAGIPQAGLVTMVMVLNVLGLPAENVTIILIVDWFLDRFRTATNVLGDAIGAAIVAHFSVLDLQLHSEAYGIQPPSQWRKHGPSVSVID